MILFLRETNQYKVLKRIESEDPKRAQNIAEFSEVTATPPKFMAPWKTIKLAFIPEFSPYVGT